MNFRDRSALLKELEEECDCSIVDSENAKINHIEESNYSPSQPLRKKFLDECAKSFDHQVDLITPESNGDKLCPYFGLTERKSKNQRKTHQNLPTLSLSKNETSVNILRKLQQKLKGTKCYKSS
ncbi:unnamed protein product [Moneuplotes crassus]|uniref:Uncharacterized protein n=1 Tax=Euplotes crassus TaxID=5936 RepID=A0AAD1U7L8_EUPCR|nr:unnamed protein product [Moneuplotes crassus]